MAVSVIVFDPVEGIQVSDSLAVLDNLGAGAQVWLDIESEESALVSVVASHFGLHELSVEDCLTPGHLPKIEDYGTYIFVILRALKTNAAIDDVLDNPQHPDSRERQPEESTHLTRKVAVFLSERFLVTFRRHEVPWLDAVVRQVRQEPGELLPQGTDAWAHRVIDVLVDRFARGALHLERRIDILEDLAIEHPERFNLAQLFHTKHEVSSLRHVAREQRAVVNRLMNEGARFIKRSRRRYYRDIDDHAISIVTTLDKQVETLLGLRDSYAAFANVRLGDTMRVLTVITTIAAPLNIVVGIYGMNFEFMPLLHSHSGFYILMAAIAALSVFMLWVFRRKRWL